jgi:[acyl-carrier-protein] S-malonyltransferase
LGLEDQQVVHICAEVAENEVVAAVNFNAPGQVVIAGNTAAVDRALIAAKDAGAKRGVKLPVSVPSHCALMENAAENLYAHLQKIPFETPKMTLIHNVDITSHIAAEVIRNALKEQLFKPVRWVDGIKFMHEQGVMNFVECGPGKVLMGLNKRIAKDANHMTIFNTETFNKVVEHFND